MKKIIPLLTVLTLSFSGLALAAPHQDGKVGGFVGQEQNMQRGGFQGPSIAASSVEQVKKMPDDAKVVLRGFIVQSLGDEDYLFKDKTGTIQVEIDHKRWRGQVVTPKDLVEIRGEVDKSWKSTEIDVKRIIKLEAK